MERNRFCCDRELLQGVSCYRTLVFGALPIDGRIILWLLERQRPMADCEQAYTCRGGLQGERRLWRFA